MQNETWVSTVDQLKSVMIDEDEEETAYDAARSFADLCRRKSEKEKPPESDEEPAEEVEGEE